MKHFLLLIIGLTFAVVAVDGTTKAQEAPANLLQAIDLDNAVVAGTWNKSSAGLTVSGRYARLQLPAEVPSSYALTVEFTRESGDDSVGIILPVGKSQCVLNMSAFKGKAHGIGIVDGKIAIDNQTTRKPGNLKNEHRYRLLVEVDTTSEQATISSQLDGREFLQWRGKASDLSMLPFWQLKRNNAIGLYTNSEVTFHSVQLRRLDRSMRMTKPPASSPAVPAQANASLTFENRKWSVEHAKQVEVVTFQQKQAMRVRGADDAFVYLPNLEFGEGEIEVDIASNTFSGIGFRGSANGDVAQLVYLRPFNSGTAKHDNTVQYAVMGKRGLDWRTLRTQFPGKYEAGADIKPNEWFHVRLVVSKNRVEVYVDNSEQPVLVVDPLLESAEKGRLGVWGWDSHFANFRFTPAESVGD